MTKFSEWHGWGNGSVTLHIGHLPARKSVCLYSQRGSVMSVHAYFRSKNEALGALAVLDELMETKRP